MEPGAIVAICRHRRRCTHIDVHSFFPRRAATLGIDLGNSASLLCAGARSDGCPKLSVSGFIKCAG
jgi:hypothetical protein